MADLRNIYIYKGWGTTRPEKIGTLFVDGGKGREVISFEYEDTWLEKAGENPFETNKEKCCK